MSSTTALVVALVLAALLMAALSKPGRTLVGGFVQRDRKGRLVIALTPVKRGRKRRRGKR